MRKKNILALCLLAFILTGCATQMEPPIDHSSYTVKPWKQRRANMSARTRWNIQGSVSVQSRGKTQIGSFNWKQMGQYYVINIYGPLNLGAIEIQGQPGGVTLLKPTGAPSSASSPEALMQQQLGWYLPVSNLYFWVRGIPAPGSAKEEHDQYGHLTFLRQQGWRIQFMAFQSRGNTDLPRKIVMDNQQLHVKLVIHDWNI